MLNNNALHAAYHRYKAENPQEDIKFSVFAAGWVAARRIVDGNNKWRDIA
jgi:hypothetical protein